MAKRTIPTTGDMKIAIKRLDASIPCEIIDRDLVVADGVSMGLWVYNGTTNGYELHVRNKANNLWKSFDVADDPNCLESAAKCFVDYYSSRNKSSESRKPACSMQKKKESLLKKTEMVGDDEELTFAFDGVNVIVHEWTPAGEQGRYIQEYTINERGSFNNLTDLINYIADKVAYDDDFKNPANWTAMEVDRGELEISAATLQDENGDSDPDGNYIADFMVRIKCSITKPMHQTEIHSALSAAKIPM